MSQIRAKIAQQEYLLTCPDGQEHLLQSAASQVDAALTQARNSGQWRSREQAATWVALQTMVELHQLRAQMEQMAQMPSQLAPAEPSTHVEATTTQLQQLLDERETTASACAALLARIDAVLKPAADALIETAETAADAPQTSTLNAEPLTEAASECLSATPPHAPKAVSATSANSVSAAPADSALPTLQPDSIDHGDGTTLAIAETVAPTAPDLQWAAADDIAAPNTPKAATLPALDAAPDLDNAATAEASPTSIDTHVV